METNNNTHNVFDIARLLLSMADESGDPMSNMKIQKMLYYQQGYHLAYFDTPLFDEEIEAWMYGPVVPAVYSEYVPYEKNSITGIERPNMILSQEEGTLFQKVFDVYMRYSAIGLMEMTHREAPWIKTPTGKGSVIRKDLIRQYFKKRIS